MSIKFVDSLTKDLSNGNLFGDKLLVEKHEGFKKLEKDLKKQGVDDPAAVAAYIGRKKYGQEKFQKAAAAGKKLHESEQGQELITKLELAEHELFTLKNRLREQHMMGSTAYRDMNLPGKIRLSEQKVSDLNKQIDELLNESEQIDELSKETLGSYVIKSKLSGTGQERRKGLELAGKKIKKINNTNESEELMDTIYEMTRDELYDLIESIMETK